MLRSYDTPRAHVLGRWSRLARIVLIGTSVLSGSTAPTLGERLWSSHPDRLQTDSAGAQPAASSSAPVLLQLRVFNGPDEVTPEAKLQLFPRGERTKPIPIAVGADKAFEARVAPGFYDVQAVREQEGGRIGGIRWIEQLLVQHYPDEYGRHLQVLNFRPDFGALQLRLAPESGAAARGWSGALFAPGNEAHEVARARPVGDDLLVVVAAGRYDVRISLPDKTIHWLRDVEIPADATRLKTWPAPTP